MKESPVARPRGVPVPDWQPPPVPGPERLEGRYVVLERLDPARHAIDLHASYRSDDAVWDYLPYGPFDDADSYAAWAAPMAGAEDPFFYAIRDLSTSRWAGVASWLRIAPQAGSIEVGHIAFSPDLQGTRAATEAMALMMAWVFDAGYRRYEWKCDALNRASRQAAARLGFSYEGTFRQATVVKGRNRDTAWFSVIDSEWPALRTAFGHWLAPANFDDAGRQKTRLSDLTLPLTARRDPEG